MIASHRRARPCAVCKHDGCSYSQTLIMCRPRRVSAENMTVVTCCEMRNSERRCSHGMFRYENRLSNQGPVVMHYLPRPGKCMRSSLALLRRRLLRKSPHTQDNNHTRDRAVQSLSLVAIDGKRDSWTATTTSGCRRDRSSR